MAHKLLKQRPQAKSAESSRRLEVSRLCPLGAGKANETDGEKNVIDQQYDLFVAAPAATLFTVGAAPKFRFAGPLTINKFNLY